MVLTLCFNLLQKFFYKSKDLLDVSPLVFRSVIDKPVSLKQKVICGKNVPFLNMELSKASMNHLRIKTRYWNWPSGEQILNRKELALTLSGQKTWQLTNTFGMKHFFKQKFPCKWVHY